MRADKRMAATDGIFTHTFHVSFLPDAPPKSAFFGSLVKAVIEKTR